MSALARDITVRSVISTSAGDYVITSISWEMTGNIFAVGFKVNRDCTFSYATFGTNGDSSPDARLYRNFCSDNASEVMRDYLVLSGIMTRNASRDLVLAL